MVNDANIFNLQHVFFINLSVAFSFLPKRLNKPLLSLESTENNHALVHVRVLCVITLIASHAQNLYYYTVFMSSS